MAEPFVRTALPFALAALLVALPVEIAPDGAAFPGFGEAKALADDDDDDDGGGGGGGGGASSGGGGGSGPAGGPRRSGPNLMQWLFGETPRRVDRARPRTPPRIALPAAAPGEVVAIGLSPAGIATLLAEGFVSLAERDLAGRGRLVRFRIPPSLQPEAAIRRIAAVEPGARADLNHFYRPETDGCSAQICASWQAVGWSPPASRECAIDVTIGVVDTGINPDHAVFEGRRIEVARLSPPDARPSGLKHGTAVVAMLAGAPGSRVPGLLPDARYVVADPFVLGTAGAEFSDTYSLVAALDELARRGAEVFNLSLAGPDNRVLADSVGGLVRSRRVLVAAVGNDGPQAKPLFPAAYPGVIGVTAVDRQNRVYRRALRGAQVDFAAPGVDVATAASVSGVRPQTGTSFAAPFVTAAAALVVAAEPGIAPAEVAERLSETARDIGEPGWDPAVGHGLVQFPGCAPLYRASSGQR